jgi:type II secretory pathway pseudopilin PulG
VKTALLVGIGVVVIAIIAILASLLLLALARAKAVARVLPISAKRSRSSVKRETNSAIPWSLSINPY